MQNSSIENQSDPKDIEKINQLIINEITLISPKQMHFCFVSVETKNKKAMKSSPVFQNKMITQWSILVDSDQPTIRIFTYSASMGISSKKQIGSAILLSDQKIGFIYSNKNANKKICMINYQINVLELKKNNHFLYESNIFQDPQVEQPLKKISQSATQQAHKKTQKTNYQPQSKIYELPEQQLGNQSSQDQKMIQKKIMETSRIVDQSIRSSEEQRKLFSKYLDDSTSFINSLMVQIEEKQKVNEKILDISAINQENNESQEQLNTQQKWYTNKFNKQNYNNVKNRRKTGNHFIKASKKQLEQKVKIVYLNKDQLQKYENMFRQVSDIFVDFKQKTEKITISVQKQKDIQLAHAIAVLTKSDGKPSNLWPVQILVPGNDPILIQCKTQKMKLIGCVGKIQAKRGECQLYNLQGVKEGLLSFKIKTINTNSVQTYEAITKKIQKQQNQLIIESQLIQNKNGVNQVYLSSKIEHQNDEIGANQQGIIKRIKKNKMLNKKNNKISDMENQQQKINLNIPILLNSFGTSQFTSQVSPSPYPRQKISQNEIQNQNREIKLNEVNYGQNKWPNGNMLNLKYDKNKKHTDYLKYEHQKNDKVTFSIAPRFYEQSNQNMGKQIDTTYSLQRQQVFPKIKIKPESPKHDNSTINIETESKSHRSGNRQVFNLNFKDTQLSDRNRNITQISTKKGKDLTNLKISSVEIKLQKPNFKQIMMKLQIDNDSMPYFTSTSNQLYHHQWKDKGYFFLNVTQTSKLTLSMLQSNHKQVKTKGKCEILISKLDKKQKGILEYEHSLDNQNYGQIGKIYLQYEFFSRKNRDLKSLSLLPVYQKAQMQPIKSDAPKPFQINYQFKNKLKQFYRSNSKKNIKIERQKFRKNQRISSVTQGNSQPQKRIQLHDKVFSLLSNKNRDSIKVRKYTGGNIIIPRAVRFKTTGSELFGEPSPRLYECYTQSGKYYSKLNKI